MTTVARMKDLMSLLEADRPRSLDGETIRVLLSENGREECHLDGWGRPFVIERVGSEPANYRVTSLGRDGRRGACCDGFVKSFDEDAVLEGDRWLQRWIFKQ